MDRNKINNLIEDYIAREGAFASKDYWTRKLLNGLVDEFQDSNTYIWEHPEFEVVTQEEYDALAQAIESHKAIFVPVGELVCFAVGYMLEADLIQMAIMGVDGANGILIYIRPGEQIETYDALRMVKAGQGVEIEDDGTINCSLDPNPFIVPSDGNLPVEGQEGKIYLIPASNAGEQNVMLEYIYVNGAWEKFGEFKTEVDLSQYAKTAETVKVIDLSAYSGQERIDVIDQHLANALYRQGGTIVQYVGSYSSYRCFVSFESTNDLAMIQDRKAKIRFLSISPTTSGSYTFTIAYTSDLSDFVKAVKISSINESLSTNQLNGFFPVFLRGSVGHILCPVSLDKWQDGNIRRDVRTYVSNGYIHTWRVLSSGSEERKELLEVARTLSESTELSPKTYNTLGVLAEDTTLTFNIGRHVVPEYQGEFSFGDTVYAVTFPDGIRWSSDSVLDFKANSTYQFRILNGLGVMREFAV